MIPHFVVNVNLLSVSPRENALQSRGTNPRQTSGSDILGIKKGAEQRCGQLTRDGFQTDSLEVESLLFLQHRPRI